MREIIDPRVRVDGWVVGSFFGGMVGEESLRGESRERKDARETAERRRHGGR